MLEPFQKNKTITNSSWQWLTAAKIDYSKNYALELEQVRKQSLVDYDFQSTDI